MFKEVCFVKKHVDIRVTADGASPGARCVEQNVTELLAVPPFGRARIAHKRLNFMSEACTQLRHGLCAFWF